MFLGLRAVPKAKLLIWTTRRSTTLDPTPVTRQEAGLVDKGPLWSAEERRRRRGKASMFERMDARVAQRPAGSEHRRELAAHDARQARKWGALFLGYFFLGTQKEVTRPRSGRNAVAVDHSPPARRHSRQAFARRAPHAAQACGGSSGPSAQPPGVRSPRAACDASVRRLTLKPRLPRIGSGHRACNPPALSLRFLSQCVTST